jgi:hypothetical protein
MRWTLGVRPRLLGAAAAGLVLLQACAPIPRVIDTPKDGAQVSLSVAQQAQPKSAVSLLGQKAQPATGGAFALDIFDFAGAQKGTERLTFVYRHDDGAPPAGEERISIDVEVG